MTKEDLREKIKDFCGKTFWCIVATAIILGIVLLSCWLETVMIREVPYNIRHLWYGDSLTHYFRFTHIMTTIGGGIIAVIANLVIIFNIED